MSSLSAGGGASSSSRDQSGKQSLDAEAKEEFKTDSLSRQMRNFMLADVTAKELLK